MPRVKVYLIGIFEQESELLLSSLKLELCVKLQGSYEEILSVVESHNQMLKNYIFNSKKLHAKQYNKGLKHGMNLQ